MNVRRSRAIANIRQSIFLPIAIVGGIFLPPFRSTSDPTRHFIRIDLDGSPGQKSAPWIILAHELGG